MSEAEFEDWVDEAIAGIPAELLEQIDNCVLVIEDRPSAEEGDLLGYYDGIPLSERDSQYGMVGPDRIVLFREPIVDRCETRDEVVEEIRITVWHEVAHYFGIDDDRLHELGYD